MNVRAIFLFTAISLSVSGLVALAQETPPAQMPSEETLSKLSTPKSFDLKTITCANFLNASLTDRGYLFMMYWGFAAAKSGTTKFVTADIRNRARKLTDFCASAPKTPMFTAVTKFSQ